MKPRDWLLLLWRSLKTIFLIGVGLYCYTVWIAGGPFVGLFIGMTCLSWATFTALDVLDSFQKLRWIRTMQKELEEEEEGPWT